MAADAAPASARAAAASAEAPRGPHAMARTFPSEIEGLHANLELQERLAQHLQDENAKWRRAADALRHENNCLREEKAQLLSRLRGFESQIGGVEEDYRRVVAELDAAKAVVSELTETKQTLDEGLLDIQRLLERGDALAGSSDVSAAALIQNLRGTSSPRSQKDQDALVHVASFLAKAVAEVERQNARIEGALQACSKVAASAQRAELAAENVGELHKQVAQLLGAEADGSAGGAGGEGVGARLPRPGACEHGPADAYLRELEELRAENARLNELRRVANQKAHALAEEKEQLALMLSEAHEQLRAQGIRPQSPRRERYVSPSTPKAAPLTPKAALQEQLFDADDTHPWSQTAPQLALGAARSPLSPRTAAGTGAGASFGATVRSDGALASSELDTRALTATASSAHSQGRRNKTRGAEKRVVFMKTGSYLAPKQRAEKEARESRWFTLAGASSPAQRQG